MVKEKNDSTSERETEVNQWGETHTKCMDKALNAIF